MDKKDLTVLVLSGGLDSFVLAHQLVADGSKVRGLYVDLGKPVCQNEMATVKRLCLDLSIPVDVVNAAGLTMMQRGFVPDKFLNYDELDVEGYVESPESGSYVSGFQILLAIGSYFSQIVGSKCMVLGVIKDQVRDRPELLSVFTKMAEAVGILNPNLPKFQIVTPYARKTKAQVVEAGHSLGAPMERSWSCVFAGLNHCGVCGRCESRKNAFAKAKVEDLTKYME